MAAFLLFLLFPQPERLSEQTGMGKSNRARAGRSFESSVIAVSQLLYVKATAAEWLFPQEKATLLDVGEGT
ncbi:MAG: hypothetical protein ABSG60_05355 [Terracidiphilus sp.]|jgi:hypothetical protein